MELGAHNPALIQTNNPTEVFLVLLLGCFLAQQNLGWLAEIPLDQSRRQLSVRLIDLIGGQLSPNPPHGRFYFGYPSASI